MPAEAEARDWQLIASGLAFPEAPRWRDGALWFSDIFGRQVGRVVPGQAPAVVVEVPELPSGLGWRPDGTLLIVAMRSRQLLAHGPGGTTDLAVVAELRDLVGGDCNDMVVDGAGRAYIGNFGYDLLGGEARRAASLVLVDADGTPSRVVADELWFPNGMVISADGSTLIVAETGAERLSAFRIAEDGSLHDRRIFAFIEGTRPDGICLDAEGGVWIASPGSGQVLRVDGAGQVTDRLAAPGGVAQACTLGGPDRRTLFVCSSPTTVEAEAVGERGARILATTVSVPATADGDWSQPLGRQLP